MRNTYNSNLVMFGRGDLRLLSVNTFNFVLLLRNMSSTRMEGTDM